MMDERRKSKQGRDAYDALNKQITTKCNEAKEKCLNEQCDDIEKNRKHYSKSMHARIREISGGAVAEWVRASTGDWTFDGSSPTSVNTFLFGTLAIPFTPLASVFRMRQ